MQGKVVYKEGFSVIGIAKNGEYQKENLLKQILKEKEMISSSKVPHMITGICMAPKKENYFYIAGTEVADTTCIPNGMSVHTFPSFTYLQFKHRGPITSLGSTYNSIWNEWLPNSPYSMIEGPALEIVNTAIHSNLYSDTYEMDIYIPIKLGQ